MTTKAEPSEKDVIEISVVVRAWAEAKVSAFVLEHCELPPAEFAKLSVERFKSFEATYRARVDAEGRALDELDLARIDAVRVALGSLFFRIGGQSGRA